MCANPSATNLKEQDLRNLQLRCYYSDLIKSPIFVQEDVVSLSACSSMKHLDLSHNKLTSIEEITTSFTHLKFLQQLDITDNPASELPFKELLAIVSKDTTAVVLNGTNIGSMQEQVSLKSVLSADHSLQANS